MKFLVLSALFAVSSANHMNGVVQDALNECQKSKCPGTYEFFNEMTSNEEPDKKLDVQKWLTNMDYIFGDVPKMYPGVEQHLECVCKQCSALVEPIWQPIGREGCGKFGVELPCQAELDACLAAGNSKEVCYPDNGIYGYKKGYDLSNPEECQSLCRNAAGENKPPCNPNDPLIKLQQCLATSRINGATAATPGDTFARPSRQDMTNAWILDARFRIAYDTGIEGLPASPDDFRELLKGGATDPWADVPGLHTKYFTMTSDEQHGSGIYVFETLDALEQYMSSELFKAFGSYPHIQDVEINVYDILAGSEVTVDQGTWPSGIAFQPTREDVEKAVIFYPRFTVDFNTGVQGMPTTPEEFKASLIEPFSATVPWSGVPGLLTKYFTFQAETNVGTGVYIFKSQEDLDQYLKSDLLAAFKGYPHITNLQADTYEVVGGTERTVDLKPWPRAGKAIDVKIPCDRSTNDNGLCDGIPAEKCAALPTCGWSDVPCCTFKGTNTPCTPRSDNGRRLLFGGSALKCECK